MTIRSVIVELCVVGRQDGAFLCHRSNYYLRPQHIHSTVRYSANEHRHGRNQRDTAVYMTGRMFPSSLDNSRQFPYEMTPTKKKKCKRNEVTVGDRNGGRR